MNIDDKLRKRASRRDPEGYARLLAMEKKAHQYAASLRGKPSEHSEFVTVIWTPDHAALHTALALGYADAKAEMMRLSLYLHGYVKGEDQFEADKFIVLPGDVRMAIMSGIVPGVRALFAELQPSEGEAHTE